MRWATSRCERPRTLAQGEGLAALGRQAGDQGGDAAQLLAVGGHRLGRGLAPGGSRLGLGQGLKGDDAAAAQGAQHHRLGDLEHVGARGSMWSDPLQGREDRVGLPDDVVDLQARLSAGGAEPRAEAWLVR